MYAIIPFIVLLVFIGGLYLIANSYRTYSLRKTTDVDETHDAHNNKKNQQKAAENNSMTPLKSQGGDDESRKYVFVNNTGKIIDIECRLNKWNHPNEWLRRIENGESRELNTKYGVTLECDELSVSVFQFQMDRGAGWMYNWSPSCNVFDKASNEYRLSIEVDNLRSHHNKYKIVVT